MSAKEEENTFKMLKDYFRSQLIKYFDAIPTTKNLIIESSLIGSMQHLLIAQPESCKILGFGTLLSHRVSLDSYL